MKERIEEANKAKNLQASVEHQKQKEETELGTPKEVVKESELEPIVDKFDDKDQQNEEAMEDEDK